MWWLVSQMANSFSRFQGQSSKKANEFELQYLTPNGHGEFLSCIIESSRESVARILLDETLAISLRCDGSADRIQIDKLYVMADAVHKNGTTSLYFPEAMNRLHVVQRVCARLSNLLAQWLLANQHLATCYSKRHHLWLMVQVQIQERRRGCRLL